MTNEILRNEVFEASNETLFEKFFTKTGRLNRMTYLIRNLALLAVECFAIIVVGFVGVLGIVFLDSDPTWVEGSITSLMILALIPDYFLNVKRLHDLGKDDTLAKIFLGVGILMTAYDWAFPAISIVTPAPVVISIATLAFSVYLLFAKGEEHPNKYGNPQ